jgi:hypothetical protein
VTEKRIWKNARFWYGTDPGEKTVLHFIAKPGTAAWNCGRAGEKGKTGKGENRNAIHDHP